MAGCHPWHMGWGVAWVGSGMVQRGVRWRSKVLRSMSPSLCPIFNVIVVHFACVRWRLDYVSDVHESRLSAHRVALFSARSDAAHPKALGSRFSTPRESSQGQANATRQVQVCACGLGAFSSGLRSTGVWFKSTGVHREVQTAGTPTRGGSG